MICIIFFLYGFFMCFYACFLLILSSMLTSMNTMASTQHDVSLRDKIGQMFIQAGNISLDRVNDAYQRIVFLKKSLKYRENESELKSDAGE